MRQFYSPGKILVTAEYLVLDGAMALALPTKFGQSLQVRQFSGSQILWRSLDQEGKTWFEGVFETADIRKGNSDNRSNPVEQRIFTLLAKAHSESECFPPGSGYEVTTQVNFPLDWGLGTSSTLVADIAKWTEADPYSLLEKSFGGSGYDVAVAMEERSLIYQLVNQSRTSFGVTFNPPFTNKLFFVYLNRKQNSRTSIAQYRARKKRSSAPSAVEKISSLTQQILRCSDLKEFELLLGIHERIISQVVGLPTIRKKAFPDYPGELKSLGGWGGDFILATGTESEKEYFYSKGYTTILSYDRMIGLTSPVLDK